MTTVTLAGTPIEVSGTFLAVNSRAPEFSLVGKDLADVTLSSFGNTRKILNIVPSLDTAVCAASARKFNQQASSLKDTVVLVISADLPFAMGRFCSVEGLDRVIPLSLMRGRKFLRDYGVDITSGPLAGAAARAVFVLDRDNTVLYSQLVPEIKQEPNYDGALAALA